MFTEDLLATCWTTAGDASPMRDDWRSPVPLRERIEAASAAGFRGFGIVFPDLVEAEHQYGMAAIRGMLDDNGLVHVELEGLPNWWTDGPLRKESDRVRAALLDAAEKLGARRLKVTPDDSGDPWELDHWAAEFRTLASQAHDVGARLGIEFLPWCNIRTVRDGLRLVEEAGHEAGGLIIDVWHTERTHTPPDELAKVPLQRIVGVELNDAEVDPVGTLFEDTVNRRRYCGQGSFDLQADIRALRSAGWTGPWGIEILSDEHRSLDVQTAAFQAYSTGLAQLELATEQP